MVADRRQRGKALIPVDREHGAAGSLWRRPRLRLSAACLQLQRGADAAVEALENAGLPVVRIALRDVYDIGQEFFRWEIATGGPAQRWASTFHQPDVEASKIVTKELTTAYEKTGTAQERPIFEEHGIKLYADAENAQSCTATIP